ncbi:MAG TPA: hypothetical protein VMJ31_00795 [Methylocystis sp.]|nr:hypothetical protein [Methylocystis sp.]
MTQGFSVAPLRHGFLGPLIALALPGQPCRQLTPQEAAILSRALAAVAKGLSPEHEIFMSPVASDCDFEARVISSGVAVVAPGCADANLSFDEALRLARALQQLSEASQQTSPAA